MRTLRLRLAALDVTDPSSYGSHDFRRGHAVDMQMNGRSLAEILRAGSLALMHFAYWHLVLSCAQVRGQALRL